MTEVYSESCLKRRKTNRKGKEARKRSNFPAILTNKVIKATAGTIVERVRETKKVEIKEKEAAN